MYGPVNIASKPVFYTPQYEYMDFISACTQAGRQAGRQTESEDPSFFLSRTLKISRAELRKAMTESTADWF